MKLDVTDKAVEWYENEYEIIDMTQMRLFVRYGGIGGLIPGFSLGLSIETPNDIYAEKTINNMTFYIEKQDAWYFEDKDLLIDFNHDLQEPKFIYQ